MVGHDVVVRGIGLEAERKPRPVLLAMRDSDFPQRFFADLGQPRNRRLSSARAAEYGDSGYLRLLQPVQRMVQVALVDLSCAVVGEPRLSGRKVESAGLVIRRVARSGDLRDRQSDERIARHDRKLEAWVRNVDGKFRWRQLRPNDDDLDPDPTRRPALRSGQQELDRQLLAATLATADTEVFSPAFVVPPDICERTGRTIVFAAIPTASSEVSDAPPAALEIPAGSLDTMIPPLLRPGSHSVPLAGAGVDHRYMSPDFCAANNAADFNRFSGLMQTLALGFGAFENTPEGQALRDALNRRRVTFGKDSKEKLADFLARAHTYLLGYNPETNAPSDSLRMPDSWDAVTAQDEAAFRRAAESAVRARSARLLAREGRFQDHTHLYRLRVFVRLKPEPPCPGKTLWSPYSDLFQIAPWYESAGVAGPPVPLPDPTQDFLKAAKPNVSFVVPDSLMSTMQAASLQKMSGGSVSPTKLGLTFLCSFNIPIITI
ncbi:MAG TPA: hypothetical protein VFU76_16880, partial [Terriglobales bacterium]|nr:hypothetical protein [Terriglobales bacterium]